MVNVSRLVPEMAEEEATTALVPAGSPECNTIRPDVPNFTDSLKVNTIGLLTETFVGWVISGLNVLT